jgi:hypothetical protein
MLLPACRRMQEDDDPVVQEVLEGTHGDPDKIRQNIDEYTERTAEQKMLQPKEGSEVPMRVRFRGYDPQAAWVRVATTCTCHRPFCCLPAL